jgi:hypothetical protein
MSDAALPLSYHSHPVWLALAAYSIGPEDAALGFSRCLARENGWSGDYTARVIAEYYRFAFLAVTVDHPVTPSDAVDQAWHLHLCYTRDYWQRFCPDVLGRDLHHGPTAGGLIEEHRYFDQYAATLASYRAVFGECAPEDIWPAAAKRLRDDPRARRVHPRDAFVLPKQNAMIAGAAILFCAGLFLLT